MNNVVCMQILELVRCRTLLFQAVSMLMPPFLWTLVCFQMSSEGDIQKVLNIPQSRDVTRQVSVCPGCLISALQHHTSKNILLDWPQTPVCALNREQSVPGIVLLWGEDGSDICSHFPADTDWKSILLKYVGGCLSACLCLWFSASACGWAVISAPCAFITPPCKSRRVYTSILDLIK